jgi:peptide/nickel transport system permease protein
MPSELYWFGTDMLGRDIYSRVTYGARVSLTVGFSVAILASVMRARGRSLRRLRALG